MCSNTDVLDSLYVTPNCYNFLFIILIFLQVTIKLKFLAQSLFYTLASNDQEGGHFLTLFKQYVNLKDENVKPQDVQ